LLPKILARWKTLNSLISVSSLVTKFAEIDAPLTFCYNCMA
jgi:hypothetical protein